MIKKLFWLAVQPNLSFPKNTSSTATFVNKPVYRGQPDFPFLPPHASTHIY